MGKRAYRFTMAPEQIDDVTEYLVVDLSEEEATDNHAAIEEDPTGYFGELVDDRLPGYELDDWDEIDPADVPKNASPYTLS